MSPASTFGLSLITVSLFGLAVFGQDPIPSLPNPSLTPGAVVQGYKMICSPPYAPPRTWHDKAGTLAKYGYPASMAALFEDDDRVPVCLGGDNADPANHWAQRCDKWSEDHRCVAGEAHGKDVLEERVCKAVCAHQLSPEQGRAIFLGDWRPFLGAKL